MNFDQPITLSSTHTTENIGHENQTYEDEYTDGTFYAFACSFIAISLFGMIGNGIVLWNLIFRIRRNPFTVYILNLSIIDFIFLFVFFLEVVIFMLAVNGFNIAVNIFYFFTHIFMVGYSLSLRLLTAVSIERSVAILFPIWYQCHRPKNQSTIVCIILWVVSCLTFATRNLLCNAEEGCGSLHTYDCATNILLFTPLMILSNFALIIKLLKSSQRKHPARMYILIITAVSAFIILSLPLSIVDFFLDKKAAFVYFVLATACSTLNSSLNPVIYFLVGSIKRHVIGSSVISAFKRAFQDGINPPH